MRSLLMMLLCAAAAFADTVVLKPSAETAGPYVTLGEVALVEGPGLSELFLGLAPAPGESRRLTRREVQGRLAYLGLSATVEGAEETELVASGKGRDLRRLAGALGTEIQARLGGGWALSALELPASWIDAELLEVGSAPARDGELAVRLRGRRPDGTLEERRQAVSARRVLRVAVARRALRSGQALAAEDVMMKEMPEAEAPPGALRSAGACVGCRLSRSVAAGAVIEPGALVAPRLVGSGSPCILVNGAGKVRVRCQAKALAEGRLGELIPFEILDSGKTVRARVTAAGEADLGLEHEKEDGTCGR